MQKFSETHRPRSSVLDGGPPLAVKPEISTAENQSLPRWTIYGAASAIIVFTAGFIKAPLASTYFLSAAMGAFVYLYSVLRTIAALCPAPKPSNASALQDYPVISILLPVYNEAHMLKTLTSHILCTKYPAERLDIVIVCEPDDTETVTAARCLESDDIAVFVTDGSGPRTKPNALNQALPICRGEIITVYDAEDRPDPAQLHAAAAALFNDQSLAVVQAPLIYYNSNQNWLTRQFTLEYAALFFVWLPFLSRLGLPFPLGGTSNHIRGLM